MRISQNNWQTIKDFELPIAILESDISTVMKNKTERKDNNFIGITLISDKRLYLDHKLLIMLDTKIPESQDNRNWTLFAFATIL